MDDSACLQHQYAGTENAKQFEQQEALVIEKRGSLQDEAARRTISLQSAINFYRFLDSVSSTMFYSLHSLVLFSL